MPSLPPFGTVQRPLLLTLAIGLLMRSVVGLQPSAWVAWIAPGLLLWAVLREPSRSWRIIAIVASLIGYVSNAPGYFRILPVPIAVIVIVLQSLVWLLVFGLTHRVVHRFRQPWTLLAYPVFWVAIDTLMANFLPDGNWGGLGYTQADFLPLMQTASVFGIPGVLFVLCLLPSAIAVLAVLGYQSRQARRWLAGATAATLASLVFGTVRLNQAKPQTASLPVGIASVDDAIGLEAKPFWINRIQAAYDTHIAALASSGARLVLLPEKIAVIRQADVPAWDRRFAAIAARDHLWLLAGVAIETPKGITNDAWLFDPNGRRAATYQKHFLAPPERGQYLAAADYVLHDIEGAPFGIAICKDMHFSRLGRAYGQRGPAAMLVPAWDFDLDRWMGARITMVRGIENGYTVIRAARDGWLTISDPYGRNLIERDSADLPGARLLARVPLTPQIHTIYTTIGDSFGWLCVAAAVVITLLALRR